MYVGYGDGVICFWEITNNLTKVTAKELKPLLGHTNKINHLAHGNNYLFSSSDDCTVRQWNIASENCVRIYKFADPMYCSVVHPDMNLLFTGSWDKIVRAIDLKTGEVDQSFVAA